MERESLFRRQALEYQQRRLRGVVSLAQPVSLWVFVIVCLLVVPVVLGFLFSNQVARKETVSGFLQPGQGIVRAYSDRPGIVRRMHVRDGERVNRGDPLVTLFTQGTTIGGLDVGPAGALAIKRQLAALDREIQAVQALSQKESLRLALVIENLELRLKGMDRQKTLVERRSRLIRQRVERYEVLTRHGHLAKHVVDELLAALLEVAQEQEAISALELEIKRELVDLRGRHQGLPDELRLRQSALNRNRADLDRRLHETEAAFEFLVKAPEAGRVTAVRAVEGARTTPSAPLLSIIPSGSTLTAELLLPTRAIGLMRPGLTTLLRFDAFPHQRFGFVRGEILSVDQSLTLAPTDSQPLLSREPVYRVRSSLEQLAIRDGATQYPLRPGMLLEADIILERRSLLAWLFEPFLKVRNRLR